MRWLKLGGLLATGMVVLSQASSLAQLANPKVGTQVVLKGDEVRKVGPRIVDPSQEPRVYRVEKTSGPWVWVVSDALSGWVRSKDLIPFDQAVEFYDEAIKKDPKAAWPYVMRGIVWSDQGKYSRAIRDFTEALKLDPDSASAYINRGNIHLTLKNYDKAVADFTDAIRLAPKDAKAYTDRGNVWLAQGAYAKALADYKEAVRLAPRHPAAYNNRAWIWATCPDKEFRDGTRSIQSASIACELTGWKDPYEIGTLAASYAEAGDFDTAAKWQQKAIDLIEAKDLREEAKNRLVLYKQRKPFRDEAKAAR